MRWKINVVLCVTTREHNNLNNRDDDEEDDDDGDGIEVIILFDTVSGGGWGNFVRMEKKSVSVVTG